ncbi:histidine kinase dimerization/phospho-acceptor domain-containing protein [Anaerosporobacter sp.]
MRKNELYFDARITRRYFSLPAFIFFVFFLAIVMALPAGFYGGFNLIWENSGPYVKWYFVYCIVVALLISVVLSLEKYLSFDRHIKTLSSAAKKVAEGDFSVYLPIRHAVNDMDYIDTLFMDFNTMVEELGSIETLKNDFAANVSHELKTPLAVIQNYGQLLQSTELTAAQKEYVDSIIESTHRLASLIFNILKLNKLESQ